MQITRKGKKYILDIEKAIELGVLKAKSRPIKISDIPNGAVFRWKFEENYDYYLMLDNKKLDRGQSISITSSGESTSPYNAWFEDETEDLSFLDVKKEEWVSEIEG